MGQRVVQKDAPADADSWWMGKEAGRNCFSLDRPQLDGDGEKIKQKAQRVIGGRKKEIMLWAYLVFE